MRTTLAVCSCALAFPLFLGCGRGGLGGHSTGSGGAAGGPQASGGSGGAAGTGGSALLRTGGAGGASIASGGDGGVASAGGSSWRGGAGGTGATTTACAFVCAVDFPCWHDGRDKPKCVVGNPSSIAIGREVSCEEACGTPCCTGGGCRVETNACPSGTVCVYPDDTATAACVPTSQACGGFLGNTCAAGEYCELFAPSCSDGSMGCLPYSDRCTYVNSGATGVCKAFPGPSECAKLTTPVCGCDGVTYKDDCARLAAGIAASYSGECRAGTGGAGGRGGAGGSGGRGGAGGAGDGGAVSHGGSRSDGGPPVDAPADAFCTGADNKLGLHGRTWVVPATSKRIDPAMSSGVGYAVRLHSQAAVGEDLDAELRFNVGALHAGTFSLLSQAIGPTLRSSTARLDAGAGDPLWEGTVVITGAPKENEQAWQMGLCAQVSDPSSQWQGLQIYVAGVPVAPSSWSGRFRMWRLKDPSLRATDVASADIHQLELASEPLLDLADVDFVEPESARCKLGGPCTWVALNGYFLSAKSLLAGIQGTAGSVDLHGVPFVVEADGERIYLGAFETAISSIGAPGPGVVVEEISEEGFAIYPPPGMRPPASDLRNDPRIIKVFTEAGKIP